MRGGLCTRSAICLLQERRRAERAEQQRFRTEKERERQAKLAVGASPPPGKGFPLMTSVTPRKSHAYYPWILLLEGSETPTELNLAKRELYWLI